MDFICAPKDDIYFIYSESVETLAVVLSDCYALQMEKLSSNKTFKQKTKISKELTSNRRLGRA